MSTSPPTTPSQPPYDWPQDSFPDGSAYTDVPAVGPPASGAAGWRQNVAALWRYKWLILLVTFLGTGAGALATRFIEPVYQAHATIWIESGGGREGGEPIESPDLPESYGWEDLVESYLVLDSVASQLRLHLEAEAMDRDALAEFDLADRFRPGAYRLTVGGDGTRFRLVTAEGQQLQQGVQGDSVGVHLGFRWVPAPSAFVPGRTIAFTVGDPLDAANALRESLSAEVNANGNVLRLSLRGGDPERMAEILNAVAERFRAVATRLKSEKLDQIAAMLGAQRDYAEERLLEAERELARFQAGSGTRPSARASPGTAGVPITQDAAVANFFNLKLEQDQLRRDRESIERALVQVPDSGLSVEALESISSVHQSSELTRALGELTQKRAELRALRQSYDDRHQIVRDAEEKIRALESGTIPALVGRLAHAVAAREGELDSLIAAASTEMSRISPRAIEEAGQQRRVDIAEAFYNELQVRHEQALLAAVHDIPDVQVIDNAVTPRQPVNPNRNLHVILLAFLASVGLAVAGAIVLDRIDPSIRYPDEVSRGLGMTILGAIPHMGNGAGTGLGNTPEVTEALRLIRLGVINAYGTAGSVVIAVTSPAASEGKSFVSSNLALSFAELGRRTVILDADVRRGRLHHIFGGVRKPGLTDCLGGRIPARSVIQATQHRNLDCISCGTRRRDGPELLQSPEMARLIESLHAAYEVVLVDSPPIGVGADALALGTLTGNLVIVLRTGWTGREVTEAKLDLLDRLPVRVLGAILNDVPERGVYKHTYESYRSYLPGYEAWDEDDPGLLAESAAATEEGAGSSTVRTIVAPGGGDAAPEADLQPSNASEEAGEVDAADAYFSVPEKRPGGKTWPADNPEQHLDLFRQHQRRSQQRHWRQ